MSLKSLARESKLRFIGQAHTAPGMSLDRLEGIILARHGVPLQKGSNPWANVPESVLDTIVADIQAVITASVQEGQP